MKKVYIFYDHLEYLLPLGIFYNYHLVILRSFGIFSPILEYCTYKNLATLLQRHTSARKTQWKKELISSHD
jgi:hypothetical protein